MDPITEELFRSVEEVVRALGARALEDDKLILTEVDLQAWVFAELVKDSPIDAISNGSVHVHAEFNYLKNGNQLGLIPDIVLIPNNSYTVGPDGELFYRKNYTFWGSSIALELKLLRSHRSDGLINGISRDLEKLQEIRNQHYDSNPNHLFFGASVVFCRQHLCRQDQECIELSSRERNIPVWLINPLPNG